jgi:CheY-like chemotaxis protein
MVRFLVVDDNHAIVAGLTRLLIGDGHTVAPFTEGALAIEAISRESFDAIVTDLEMPDVDGHAVVRAARQRQPDACVVVATARANEAHARMVAAGACMVVDKQVEYSEITDAVGQCRARGGRRSGRCHMRSGPDGQPLVSLRRT